MGNDMLAKLDDVLKKNDACYKSYNAIADYQFLIYRLTQKGYNVYNMATIYDSVLSKNQSELTIGLSVFFAANLVHCKLTDAKYAVALDGISDILKYLPGHRLAMLALPVIQQFERVKSNELYKHNLNLLSDVQFIIHRLVKCGYEVSTGNFLREDDLILAVMFKPRNDKIFEIVLNGRQQEFSLFVEEPDKPMYYYRDLETIAALTREI